MKINRFFAIFTIACIFMGILGSTNVSAAENNLGRFVPDGRPHISDGHCLEIDNKHNAILNYKYITPVNDRPVFDVVKELMSKVR